MSNTTAIRAEATAAKPATPGSDLAGEYAAAQQDSGEVAHLYRSPYDGHHRRMHHHELDGYRPSWDRDGDFRPVVPGVGRFPVLVPVPIMRPLVPCP